VDVGRGLCSLAMSFPPAVSGNPSGFSFTSLHEYGKEEKMDPRLSMSGMTEGGFSMKTIEHFLTM